MEEIFNKKHIERILDQVGEGIQIIDGKGSIIYCNLMTGQLDNIHREEAVGKHILEIYPSLTEETSTLLQVLKSKKPILNVQQTFLNYKGQKITTVNSSIPIIEDGRAIGVLEVSRDITKVKALSEKLIDLQERLYYGHDHKKGREKGQARYTLDDMIGSSDKMEELKDKILKAAETDSSVLVYGSTGTGKELVVQSIHNSSKRRGEPFIAQNCAALPASLLESILFGTAKGSFTGAEDRPGLFELADGGTLFLDEIHSMPIELQAKLLRVLQEGYIRRVGDIRTYEIDVRVMAAINMDPMEAVEKGYLRQDLFYRLNVLSIRVPDLKERQGDIQRLVKFFIEKFNLKLHKQVLGISPQVMNFFLSYQWPGNVRELEHIIEGAMNMLEGRWIEFEDLPYYLQPSRKEKQKEKTLKDRLEDMEKGYIEGALQECEGNISNTAKKLGIPRQTLQYKINKYGINELYRNR